MPIRLMCDSDSLADLIDTPLIATYADLLPTTAAVAQLQDRFPASKILLIDRAEGDPTGLASIVDYESGAVTGTQLRNRISQMHDAQVPYPTVYCDLANVGAVRSLLEGLTYWHWIAWYGHVVVPDWPAAAVQAFNAAATGQHVDLSVVHNDEWNPTSENGAWVHQVQQDLTHADSYITTARQLLAGHDK